MAVPQDRARMYERTTVAVSAPLEGVRVSWGGVWSGFLIGMGVLLLLSTLGLAIGVSTADLGPGQDVNASGLGIGAAIWGGLSLLIALFIGGMVATRMGMVFDQASGMVQGALVWVLAILAIIYLAGSGIGLVASSTMGILGGLTRGVGAAAGSVNLTDLASGDVDQIVARLNDPKTVNMVAATTGMPQAEAQSTLARIRERVEAARNDPTRAAAEARQGLQELASRAGQRVASAAAAVQPYATATMWTTLVAMVLALVAAIGGAMVGRRRAAVRVGEE